MSIIVTVNAIETNTSGISIVNAITYEPDSCTFTLHAPDNVPLAGQEVFCYLNSTSGTVLFGGVIISVKQAKLGISIDSSIREYSYQVECQDFSKLLNQRLVIETYVSRKSDYIIADFVSSFTDSAFGFTTNNVEVSRTITRIVFNYIPVTEAIQQLADLLLWDWYVDSNKDIHFFEKESRSAPFVINDTAVVTTINNFQIVPDYTQVRNRVYVRGGTEVSAATKNQTWVADGEERIWSIKHNDTSNFSMTINTGGGAVPVTIGTDYLDPDDGTYAYYFNSSEKYIRAGDGTPTATPGDGDILEATYNFRKPIIVRADNTASQTAIAIIEGGDGIYEDIIRDNSIDSTSIAQDRATAEVNQFGNATINGKFTTYESGFIAGQFVEVAVPGYETFDGNYQIQRVSINAAGPNDELYTVTFASTLYELKDFLLAIVKEFSRLKLRADEIVDVLKILSETITSTDSLTAVTLAAHPIKWGVPKWGMTTWG